MLDTISRCTYAQANKRNLILGHSNAIFKLFQDFGETTTTHKLHNNPDLIILEVAFDILDNVWMDGCLHDSNFSHKQFHVLGIDWHLLDSHRFSSPGIFRQKYFSCSTLTDFACITINLIWILLVDQVIFL